KVDALPDSPLLPGDAVTDAEVRRPLRRPDLHADRIAGVEIKAEPAALIGLADDGVVTADRDQLAPVVVVRRGRDPRPGGRLLRGAEHDATLQQLRPGQDVTDLLLVRVEADVNLLPGVALVVEDQ